MTTIKKAYVAIHELLEANQNKKVESLMPQLLELMESKQRDINHKTEDGKLYIFCYYHKEWECVEDVEYGTKSSTPTGLNTMCKIGVNQWTKQQREFSKAKSDILTKLMNQEISVEDSQELMVEAETMRTSIVPLS